MAEVMFGLNNQFEVFSLKGCRGLLRMQVCAVGAFAV
jgi:hypothetical protein